jgi:hypothetical protein
MQLPASVREIANVIGVERALYLIGQLPRCFAGVGTKGGTGRDKCTRKSWRVIMYVPKSLKPNDQLVRILGWHDACKLVAEFGGEILQPANCAHVYKRFRDISIARMLQAGDKPQAIAELMGVSERHVRNIKREIPQEAPPAANDNNRPTKSQGAA